MKTDRQEQPANYDAFLNRQERRSETLDAHRVADLAALLDIDLQTLAPNGALPPLAHWLYFNPWTRQSELGPDGHPRRGGFLPPVALPRRMFAGGRMTFHSSLVLGEKAERVSTITAISRKTGSSGELVFVTVRHEIFGQRGLAITEEQDIVYRDVTAPGSQGSAATPAAAPIEPGPIVKRVQVDPVLLFRFSAVTSNAHRIHYDYPYVTSVEHYPGLIVHGPLQAVMLLELVREHFSEPVARFTFQARRPIFDTAPFFDCVGRRTESGVDLETRDSSGYACMKASVTFA